MNSSKISTCLWIKQKLRAEAIVETFLKQNAPEEINTDKSTLEETLKRFEKAKKWEILFDSSIFEPCLRIVSHDLQHDGFGRFKFEKFFSDLWNPKSPSLDWKNLNNFTSKNHKKKDLEKEIHSDDESDHWIWWNHL